MVSISVVLPTYNSSKTIARCLESILDQTSPCERIVVVDRFSNDGTAEIARGYGVVLIQTMANRSSARNAGLAESRSPGVLFVDSDMILPPNIAGRSAALA